MELQCLNGTWRYRVGKGAWQKRQVPFSALAVGHSECECTFDLQHQGERILLCFDGITYQADVTLNHTYLGRMLPYCEYTFDITHIVHQKNNCLHVELEDMSPAFGPTEGWENYGGIIRSVHLMYAPSNRIENVFVKTRLENQYRDALYSVHVTLTEQEKARLRIVLKKNGQVIDRYFQEGRVLERCIPSAAIWSPEHPELYTLEVELLRDDVVQDAYSCQVGFRSFEMERHRFLLNGQPLFLKGVCRHEMFKEGGHTVNEEQIEKDLRMIKETGCNFVRLVHYPHHKATLDIADRLGLMVSEEPGLWQTDTSNPEVRSASLEVLKRTVLRDRNHPCIVFWLCFNECDFSEQFLKEAVQVCRTWDDTRLVSGANNMSNADTLKYYQLCGLDFYTTHPYSETFDLAQAAAQTLIDKPLMFTEWGGYYVYDNPHLLSDFLDKMHALYLQNSDEGALAGTCLWYWAEINDFDRGGAACVDGVLKEALVDADRNPTLIYSAFCQALKRMEEVKKPEELYEYHDCMTLEDCLTPIPMPCEQHASRLLALCRQIPINRLCKSRKYQFKVGPVLQKAETKGMLLIPQVVSAGDAISFPVNKQVKRLVLLGCTSVRKGYPISGTYGEVAAEIVLEHADGKETRRVLRNGMEITTALTCLGSSRIHPVCENAPCYARFSYDKNFENYLINRLDIMLDEQIYCRKLTIRDVGNGYDTLFYGAWIEA